MSFQLGEFQELLRAVFTFLHRPLLVDTNDVLVQAVLTVVGLGALGALEAFIVLVEVVHAGVLPQVPGVRERLLAVGAFERQGIFVDLLSVSSNLEKVQVNGYRLLYLKSHRKQASWDSLRTTDTSPLRIKVSVH